MVKAARYSTWGLKNLCILSENLAGGLGSRREYYWGCVSTFENTLEKLILKSIFPLKVALTLLSGSYLLTRKGAVGA